MNSRHRNRQLPAGNPLANVLVVLVGALVIGVSLVLGFVAFIVLGSIVAVLAAIIGIRLWWFRRRLRRQGKAGGQGARSESRGSDGRVDVIEGEYRVVSRTERDRD